MMRSAAELRRAHRRQTRRQVSKAQVLAALSDGATLQRVNRPGGVQWLLSDGREISSQVAGAVISDVSVIGVGDALFGAKLSQTFRLVGPDTSDDGAAINNKSPDDIAQLAPSGVA
jgi:hypothetical protein